MRIHTTKEQLDDRDIEAILSRHELQYMSRIQRLKNYYKGEHPVLNKQRRSSNAPNNRIVANYCEYIANMSTGFFMGQPVAYASASGNTEAVTLLQDILRYNDEAAHNVKLAEEASVTGAAFEILYTDKDAAIRFCAVPAEEVILVLDATLEENLLYAIRRYRVQDVGGTTYEDYVDVYDSRMVAHYNYTGGRLVQMGEAPHYFDGVPVIEYPNNEGRRGDFEGVLSLVDAYNKAQSLTLDDMEDFTDAYLVIKGMGGMTGDDAKELRRNKILSLPEDGGSAEWLIKNLNDTYIENIKTRLQNDIHKFSSIPDMSDDAFAGNTSGVAIKYKLIGLEQIRSRKERGFKRGLQRRIELIADMLKTKGKAGLDFRDIDITFTANIPANNEELAQIVKTLYGLVSQKKLLSLLPFVQDPAEELEALKKEQEEGDGEDEHEHGLLGEAATGARGALAKEEQEGT